MVASEFVEWDTWDIGDFLFGITKSHRAFVPGRRGPSITPESGFSAGCYGRSLSSQEFLSSPPRLRMPSLAETKSRFPF